MEKRDSRICTKENMTIWHTYHNSNKFSVITSKPHIWMIIVRHMTEQKKRNKSRKSHSNQRNKVLLLTTEMHFLHMCWNVSNRSFFSSVSLKHLVMFNFLLTSRKNKRCRTGFFFTICITFSRYVILSLLYHSQFVSFSISLFVSHHRFLFNQMKWCKLFFSSRLLSFSALSVEMCVCANVFNVTFHYSMTGVSFWFSHTKMLERKIANDENDVYT